MTKNTNPSLIWGAIFLLLIYGGSIAVLLAQGVTHTPIVDTGISLPSHNTGIVIQTPVSTVLKLFTFPVGAFVWALYLLPIVEYIRDIVRSDLKYISECPSFDIVTYICLGIFLPAILSLCASLLIPHMGLDLSIVDELGVHQVCMFNASAIAVVAVSIAYLTVLVKHIKAKKKE